MMRWIIVLVVSTVWAAAWINFEREILNWVTFTWRFYIHD